MNRNISKARRFFNNFIAGINRQDHIELTGFWEAKIIRADGTIEEKTLKNIVTGEGLDEIAKLAMANAGSAAFYLGVGTVTAAASLDSTVTGFGEVSRKIPVTKTSSGDTMTMTMTWGGAADSVTSVVLESAAMLNHANSGLGEAYNIVVGVSATLADSDFLNLTAQIRVGSH